MRSKWLIALTGVIIASGCASLKMDPSVYSKKKMAIIAYYGPAKPDMQGFGLAGSIQSVANGWTEKVVNTTYEEAVARMQRTMAVSFSAGSAAAAPSYTKLPTVWSEASYVNAKGLKPLKDADENDLLFAQVARELKVDAVMIFSHTWSLIKDEGSTRPYASDIFEVTIVDSTGKRVWAQRDSVESAKADLSLSGFGASLVGAIKDEDAIPLTKEATMKAVDKFLAAWVEKKNH